MRCSISSSTIVFAMFRLSLLKVMIFFFLQDYKCSSSTIIINKFYKVKTYDRWITCIQTKGHRQYLYSSSWAKPKNLTNSDPLDTIKCFYMDIGGWESANEKVTVGSSVKKGGEIGITNVR